MLHSPATELVAPLVPSLSEPKCNGPSRAFAAGLSRLLPWFRSAGILGYILVLDDDDATRELLDILLTEEGYEVRAASNAAEALALAGERQPALILFDMLLGTLRGAAFVESYRQLPQ